MQARLPVPVPGTRAGRGEVRRLDFVTGQSGEPAEHNRSGAFSIGVRSTWPDGLAPTFESILPASTITADEHETGRAYRVASLCHSKAAFGGVLFGCLPRRHFQGTMNAGRITTGRPNINGSRSPWRCGWNRSRLHALRV